MTATKKQIFWLTSFSIGMGFMETAIVIYLRKIYYPTGFGFPLVPIDNSIAIVEIFREAATIIMLIGIGILTGKTSSQKFAFFIYCFAVWDLFYYIFLKIFLDWPVSFFTWDILFLIPVPWVGPVIAPCIVSLTIIIFAIRIISSDENVKSGFRDWMLPIAGSIILIISFMYDYLQYISTNSSAHVWNIMNPHPMLNEIKNYMPVDFNWWIFGLGEIILILAVFLYKRKLNPTKSET